MRLVALLALLSICNPLRAAIAFVNCRAAGDDSVTVVNTAATSHTAGNHLYVVAGFREACGSITMTITNTAGDTFDLIPVNGSTDYLDNTNLTCQGQWEAKNIIGNASDVVTLTVSQSVRFPAVSVAQASGLDTASPFDVKQTGIEVSDGVVTSGSFTTTTANQIIYGGAKMYTGGPAPTPDTGYTLPADCFESFTGSLAIEYKIVSAIQTTVTTSLDASGGGSILSIQVATFKEASAGPSYVSNQSVIVVGP